jgi:hypothetical protein
MSLKEFTDAYIVAALWSSNDDDGNPLDASYDFRDFDPESQAKIKADCKAFYDAHSAKWAGQFRHAVQWSDDALAGHDFWFTRSGHGAGFWDGDWTQEVGDALTEACKAFRVCDIYVVDDGTLYVT